MAYRQGATGRLEAPPWHALEPTRVSELLQTSPERGLEPAQAAERLEQYGPN